MLNLRRFGWLNRLVFVLLGMAIAIAIQVLPSHSQGAEKTLKVGTEPTFPPFEMKAETGDGLQGFSIDLMRAIAKEAGYNIEFVSLPFDGLIPALQAQTIDAASSSMTITAERLQTIDFSRPYFKAGLALAVRENNQDIKGFEDLKNKKIAVQIGTTGAEEAGKVPGAQISTFDNAPLALQELANGRVDAVVNDAPVTLYAIKDAQLKGIKVVGELLTEEYYGIALPKNSPNKAPIDGAIAKIIENGTYQNIYQKWFATQAPELPEIPPGLAQESVKAFDYGKLFASLLQGALVTLTLTAYSIILGAIGGALIAIALISPYAILRWLCRAYVEFFRGTPMLVQIFMIYFGLPALFRGFGLDFNLPRFPAAVIALSLNSAAYLAEIFRGGIESIDRGQWEASESLGMGSVQTMCYVIFPQAFRRMLPPLSNEFITLIKDTSLVAVIGFEELFREGQLVVANTYRAFEVYVSVALVYLVLTSLSAAGFRWLESYMNPLKEVKKIKSTKSKAQLQTNK
jgi:arginine/lysine/histidine/glutamine transport system substrate-binding and permease protein